MCPRKRRGCDLVFIRGGMGPVEVLQGYLVVILILSLVGV